MVHTFTPLVRAFNSVNFSIPHMYPAHVEIGQITVTASEVYRTIHTAFMTLKCTFTVLNTRRSRAVSVLITPTFSFRDGCPASVSWQLSAAYQFFLITVVLFRGLRQLSGLFLAWYISRLRSSCRHHNRHYCVRNNSHRSCLQNLEPSLHMRWPFSKWSGTRCLDWWIVCEYLYNTLHSST